MKTVGFLFPHGLISQIFASPTIRSTVRFSASSSRAVRILGMVNPIIMTMRITTTTNSIRVNPLWFPDQGSPAPFTHGLKGLIPAPSC
jgi:hypothetical protein